MTAAKRNELLPYAISAASGLAICLAITLVTGRKEAWDSSLYFVAGIPAMCAVAFAVGYAFPVRPWRWAAAMALGQSIAMALSGNSLSLWPLAIIAMTILSVPQFIASLVAGRISRRTPG